MINEFNKGYTNSLWHNGDSQIESDSLSQVLQLLIEKKIRLYEGWRMYSEGREVSYEAYSSTVYKVITSCVKGLDKNLLKHSISISQGYIELKKIQKKKSKAQKYRDEVLWKMSVGRTDFETTSISLLPRDMYSILTELGIEVSVSDTNARGRYIDWDRCKDLFAKLRNGELILSEFVRGVKERLGLSYLGLTTVRYKLREEGLNKGSLFFVEEFYLPQEMEMWERTEEESGKEFDVRDLKTSDLFTSYSLGEIAFYYGLSVRETIEISENTEMNKSEREWFKYINYYNPKKIEYRVENMKEFKEDLEILGVKDVSVKYGISCGTIRDWMK